jgi:hypothetical protein
MEKYLKIKNLHKDILLNTKSSLLDIKKKKDIVFNIDNEYICIGENKYYLEDLVINKIPITEELCKTFEDELLLIKDKMYFHLNNKLDMIKDITNKIKQIETLTELVMSYRNDKVLDVLKAIRNEYKNILEYIVVYSDNLLLKNHNILFFNGERELLNNNDYTIKEVSRNYKIEIEFKRRFLSYVVFNDILKTIDSFKITFIDGTTQVKFIREFLLSSKYIDVENNVSKIIIEGIGAKEIIKDIQICVGKNKTNMNRGCTILECDFSKIKITNSYLISAHEDIKIFLWKKTETDYKLPYNEFKLKYYDLNKLVKTNESIEIDLLDNYLICFIETNHSILSEIKIYGVDK